MKAAIIFLLAGISSLSFVQSNENDKIFGVNLILIRGADDNWNELNITWEDTRFLLNSSDFDNLKKSVIIISGWRGNYSSVCSSGIVKAFQTRKDEYNIFILNWYYYSKRTYFEAVKMIPPIAKFVAGHLKRMIDEGFNGDNFHLIAHSLGAHLSGRIGKNLKESYNFSLSRITGLDAAGPLFFTAIPFKLDGTRILDKTDATFVDIIHTNAYFEGANAPTGHVDFWPNGGSQQPSCGISFNFEQLFYCSHNRACELFSESVIETIPYKKFKSIQCSSFKHFEQKLCQGLPIYNYMGFYALSNATGSFFLKTNAKPPYSL